eukprot:855884-Amphidinium_carterae.1
MSAEAALPESLPVVSAEPIKLSASRISSFSHSSGKFLHPVPAPASKKAVVSAWSYRNSTWLWFNLSSTVSHPLRVG